MKIDVSKIDQSPCTPVSSVVYMVKIDFTSESNEDEQIKRMIKYLENKSKPDFGDEERKEF